jgi:predicted O-methyltransferase YrrM
MGKVDAIIDTIDQDKDHVALAEKHWRKIGIHNRITVFNNKAEAVLPTLNKSYDLIFFDGYTPSLKFLMYFERYIVHRGILLSANLFLADPRGGKYLRHLEDKRKWSSIVLQDTAISLYQGH